MSKVAVVYFSGTGNTQKMAEAVAQGAESAGAQTDLVSCESFTGRPADYDVMAFGCSAMGAEQLEESVFEPMFAGLESELNGKKILLFGSYGWGDGQWMRDWQLRCSEDGAVLIQDGIIANQEPDESVLEECRSAGAALV